MGSHTDSGLVPADADTASRRTRVASYLAEAFDSVADRVRGDNASVDEQITAALEDYIAPDHSVKERLAGYDIPIDHYSYVTVDVGADRQEVTLHPTAYTVHNEDGSETATAVAEEASVAVTRLEGTDAHRYGLAAAARGRPAVLWQALTGPLYAPAEDADSMTEDVAALMSPEIADTVETYEESVAPTTPQASVRRTCLLD